MTEAKHECPTTQATLTVPESTKLLGQCAALIAEHGPDAEVVQRFIDEHRGDDEFADLANLARALRKALDSHGGSRR